MKSTSAKSHRYLLILPVKDPASCCFLWWGGNTAALFWIESNVVTHVGCPWCTTVGWEDIAGDKAISTVTAVSQACCLSVSSWPHPVLPTNPWIGSTASVAEALPLWAAVSGRGSMWDTNKGGFDSLREAKILFSTSWGLCIAAYSRSEFRPWAYADMAQECIMYRGQVSGILNTQITDVSGISNTQSAEVRSK